MRSSRFIKLCDQEGMLLEDAVIGNVLWQWDVRGGSHNMCQQVFGSVYMHWLLTLSSMCSNELVSCLLWKLTYTLLFT